MAIEESGARLAESYFRADGHANPLAEKLKK
jgi:hypothetical protein